MHIQIDIRNTIGFSNLHQSRAKALLGHKIVITSLFTKFPWPGESKETWRFLLIHLPNGLLHMVNLALSIAAKRQARAVKINFNRLTIITTQAFAGIQESS